MNNKRNKGISPVLASIILLAVTVAVGVGVASYVFGLFGSYAEAPAVKVSGAPVLNGATGVLSVNLINTGAQSDTVVSVSTVINGTRQTVLPTSGETVGGGGAQSTVVADFLPASPIPGTAYQIRVSFTSGNILSFTVTAA
jgi:flagellin-like protein